MLSVSDTFVQDIVPGLFFRVKISHIIFQLDDLFVISSHLTRCLKCRILTIPLGGENTWDSLLPELIHICCCILRLIHEVHFRYWMSHNSRIVITRAIYGAEHVRSSNMLLLLPSSLLCMSSVLQTSLTSPLRVHIHLINKVVSMLVGRGLLLSHQYLILKFRIIGRIQDLSLTVEIRICNYPIIGRIGHIQRLHDSISLSSTQVCLNPHGLWLSPRLLLTEDGHGAGRARPVHLLFSIILWLHHLFGRIHIEIVCWHVLLAIAEAIGIIPRIISGVDDIRVLLPRNRLFVWVHWLSFRFFAADHGLAETTNLAGRFVLRIKILRFFGHVSWLYFT